jgi:PAS domain S-box-containing protein
MTEFARILVVDDSPDTLEREAVFLRQAGYVVAEARSGEEALACAREFLPDIVLLDAALPGTNGVEVTRRLKNDPHLGSCRVLLVSSEEITSEGQILALEAGADGYVGRPASSREIVARIESLLRLKRIEEALLERTRHLEAVRRVTEEITRELELGGLLQRIVQGATELLGTRVGSVYFWDETDQVLIPQVWPGQEEWERTVRLRPGEGVAGEVVRRKVGIIVNDFRTSPYATAEQLVHTTHSAVLAEPLFYRERLLGVITMDGEGGRVFTAENQGLLRLFAAQAAIAIENARLHEASVRRGAQMEALLRSFQSVTSGLDLSAILDRIIAEAARIAHTPHVKILLVEEATHGLRVASARGESVQRDFPAPLKRSLSGIVAETGRPLFIADSQDEAQNPNAAFDRQHGLRTYLGLPVRGRDGVLGVVTFNTTDPRAYSGEELSCLAFFADQAAIAIENARQYEASRRRALQLQMLNELTRTLTAALNLREVAEGIVRAAQALLPDSVGRLWQCSGTDRTLRLIANVGLRRPEEGQEFRLQPGHGLIGIAETTRQPVLCADVVTDPRFIDSAWAKAEGLASGIVLPLNYGTRPAGFLSIFTRQPHVFVVDEVELLGSLAAQAAIAIENARLFEETERQRTRLKEVLDSAVEGFYQTTPDGRFLAANHALARILGYDSPEGLLAQVTDVARQLYADPTQRREFLRLVREEGGVRDFEVRLIRRDGNAVWVAVNARAVTDEAGELLYHEGFLQDISDRKLAEQMKADFVSFATHQLRTPLAGIKWLLELAGQEGELTGEAASCVADAAASCQRLIRLVNDLLDASKLERRKVPLNLGPVDLGSLTSEAVKEVRSLLDAKGHRIRLAGPAEGAIVRADPQLLRQVLLNLLSNAIKYTLPSGAIEVRWAAEGALASWSIRDSGVGIPRDARRRLFEKFFRAENVLTLETEGTGLGLYIVKLIVEQHGGGIRCESEEGRGTTFTVELPAESSPESGVGRVE